MSTRLSKDINSNVLFGLPFAKESISFTLAAAGVADVEVPNIITNPQLGKEIECFFSYNSNGAAVFVALNTGAPLVLPVAYVGPTNYDSPAMELNPIIRYAKAADIISIVTDGTVTINIVFRIGQ